MSKKFIISQIILAFLLAGVVGVYFFEKEMGRKKMPVLGQVQNFTLTDADGKAFNLRQLEGKVWIADFFFTSCGDICPVMNKNMAALSRTFERLKDVRLVSITVNPETDTPERLREYAQKFVAGKDNWVFLTGPRETIRDIVVNSFKLGKIDEPIYHSSSFALVDRHGLIRGYYNGTTDSEVNQLFIDASNLTKEK